MINFNYWCKNCSDCEICSLCDKKGRFTLEQIGEEEFPILCPKDDITPVKRIGKQVNGIIGPKLTMAEIRKDRKGRSVSDFKRNVLPKLDPESDEGKHFKKKYKQK